MLFMRLNSRLDLSVYLLHFHVKAELNTKLADVWQYKAVLNTY